MRIGLYGMPAAGKSYILDRIDFIPVIAGSSLLRRIDPAFDSRGADGKRRVRIELANDLLEKESFIMDGHYAFGNDVVFTEADGCLYDVILYLYVTPDVLRKRMMSSEKNRKYAQFDIKLWQEREIATLREYCQIHNKDFYVLDNPPENVFDEVGGIIRFIRDIVNGYSCISYARKCAEDILAKSTSDAITLFDGDKTLTVEDSSNVFFGYATHLFDGNFYTGYQAWKQDEEFGQYTVKDVTEMPVHFNEKVKSAITADSYILTSGHKNVWEFIARRIGIGCYYGPEMAAETKLFITKELQGAGKRVVAYGDGLNDYFMLRQADVGYLVLKKDGSVSRSLRGRETEGLIIV